MNISDILVQDHIDIKKLLNSYRSATSIERCRTVFAKFAQKITEHLYQEEKALIVYCNAGGAISEKFTSALFKQHDEIIKLVDEWEKNLSTGKEFEPEKFDALELMLEQHIAFEMDSLYEGFDALLDERQKDLVADAIAQTKLMKSFPFAENRRYFKL
jgi:hypothetical protein